MGKRYLKPAEKELKNALKRLKDMKDKELCDCLIQLVQACWNGRPSLRPTALKGFVRTSHFSIKFTWVTF